MWFENVMTFRGKTKIPTDKYQASPNMQSNINKL